jgi:hypothetical protein
VTTGATVGADLGTVTDPEPGPKYGLELHAMQPNNEARVIVSRDFIG